MPASLPPFSPDDLRSNPRIVDAAASPLFTPTECEQIRSECDADAWREVAPPTEHSAERHKVEQPLPGGNTGWIGERIARRVAEVNDEIYGFRIMGLEDPVRVFSYGANEAGRFRQHIDLSSVQPMRKLTFTILLSDPADFTGGELLFEMGPFADARAQGSLTMFPSFIAHEVTPVTAGQRFVIVGWVLGPTFV